MYNYLLIAVGAACGGILRFWISGFVQKASTAGFPVGTLTVNVAGSFVLGFIIFAFDARELISPELKLMLTVGLCGGFTTFSTFSYETIALLQDSSYLLALINISLNLFLTLFAVVLSYFLAKLITGG